MARKLTPRMLERIEQLRRAGLSREAIARSVNLSQGTISNGFKMIASGALPSQAPSGVPVATAEALLRRLIESPNAICEAAAVMGEPDPVVAGERLAAILDDAAELARFASHLEHA